MAFPSVEARTETSIAAGTTLTFNFGASAAAGDLVIVFIGLNDTAQTITTTESFVNLTNASATFHIIYKILAGTEGTSSAVTVGTSTKAAAIAYTITAGTHLSSVSAPVFSTVATGTSVNPNSGSLSPTGGAKDYLWISAFRQNGEEADDDTWVTGSPTTPGTFTNLLQITSGTSGLPATNGSVGSAEYAANAATVDPGAFTTAQSLAWRAYTVAIYPGDPITSVPTAGSLTLTGATPTVTVSNNVVSIPTPVGGAAYSAAILAETGLLAYWRMDAASGTETDQKNGFTGTYEATGVTRSQTGALTGDSDTSVLLTAANSGWMTAVANGTSLDLTDGPLTLEAWIKKASTGSNHGIVSRGNGGYYIRHASDGTIEFLKSSQASIVKTTTTISDTTTWHHIVATKNGASLTLYIDGTDRTGTITNATLVNPSEVLHVGSDTVGNEPFDGYLDEVAIYGAVLTSTQVTDHWNAGNGAGGIKLTGAVPTVTVGAAANQTAVPSAASLTVSGATPAVATPVVSQPTAASLTATGATPVIAASAIPTAASLTASGATPTVVAGGTQSRQPTAASLTATGATPTVVAGGTQSRQPTAASLTTSGSVPAIASALSVPAAGLTLSGATPVVAVTTLSVPTAASLALSGATPTVVAIGTYSGQPTAASLTVSGATPTVTISASRVAVPDPAALTLSGATPAGGVVVLAQPTAASMVATGATPTVSAGGTQSRQPTAASLVATGAVPDIQAGGSISTQPTAASLTLSGATPTVTTTANVWSLPTAASLTVNGAVPGIGLPIGVTPTAVGLYLSFATPFVAVRPVVIIGYGSPGYIAAAQEVTLRGSAADVGLTGTARDADLKGASG